MKCAFKGCAETPLSLAEFCWEHLPDKKVFRERLEQAAREKKDLTGYNLKKTDLSRADLSGGHLFDSRLEGAELLGANLSHCDLTHCSLKGADLTKADLSYARLWNADMAGANLTECDLSFADLWNARLFNVKLWRADFSGAMTLAKSNFSQETGFLKNHKINEKGPLAAEESYRNLKRYFMANGMYNDASWASFKEKTMERAILKKKRDPNYIPSLVMNILCGYGEKPYRIVLASLFAILIFAFLYLSFNSVEAPGAQNQTLKWSDYIYYSTVTFTTVGYGDIIPKPHAAFRLLAACEAFIGVFLTGLFIFTLARKYSAR